MPSPSRLTPLQLVGIAAAAGIGWGVVMALVAWFREGAEIVLLQGWILVPAWFFGRATRSPRNGALAGFALVAGAVWTYEMLPGWGLEAALRREGARPEDLEAVALAFDAADIVLLSTLAIGAVIGLGGSLRPQPATPVPAPVADSPAVAEPPSAPAPLWAGFEPPQAPPPEGVAPSPPQSVAVPRARAATPWASAFLLAGLATDFFLGRLFDMYSGPQDGVALGFLLLGVVATAWMARRYAIAMALAAAVLAAGFAVVQHAEYDERRGPEIAVSGSFRAN